MNPTLTDVKTTIIDYLGRIEQGAGSLAIEPQLGPVRDALSDDHLTVAAVGEFSSGKSSLINAVVGEAVLPVSATPTTGVLTELHFGPVRSYTAVYPGGRTAEIPPHALGDTARGQGALAQGIARIVIRMSAPILEGGAVLVDTPGVESLTEGHEDITFGYLPTADAVILVLNANRGGLTHTEVTFIQRHLFQHTRERLFVAISFSDDLPSEEGEAVRSGVVEQVTGVGVAASRVFLVSGQAGLAARLAGDTTRLAESGLPSFERGLDEFLSTERVRLLATRYLDLLDAKVATVRMSLELWRRRAVLSDDEKKEFDARLREQIDSIADAWEAARGGLRSSAKQLREKYRSLVKTEVDELRAGFHAKFEAADLSDINADNLRSGLMLHVKELIERLQQDLEDDLRVLCEEAGADFKQGTAGPMDIAAPGLDLGLLVNGLIARAVAFVGAVILLDVLLPLGPITALLAKWLLREAVDLQKMIEDGLRGLIWRQIDGVFPDLEDRLNSAFSMALERAQDQIERGLSDAANDQTRAIEAAIDGERLERLDDLDRLKRHADALDVILNQAADLRLKLVG